MSIEAKIEKPDWRRLGKHLAFWIGILLFFSGFDLIISDSSPLHSILVNLMYLPQDILLVYLIIEGLVPRFFLTKKYLLFVLGIVMVLMINLALSFLVDALLIEWLDIVPGDEHPVKRVFLSILVFSFIASLATVLKLNTLNHRMLLKKEAAEARYHRAELSLLRSQINPHFLFNVFNNIDELIYHDTEKASEALNSLSDSLRYVLKEGDVEMVSLSEEIEFLQSYLQVASLSLNTRGFIDFQASEGCKKHRVAPMIFIPFIENCVKHCNRRAPVPGIEILIECDDGHIHMHCRNQVKPEIKSPDPGNGYGLTNALKRLDLIYGSDYQLEAGPEGRNYIVDLKIPVP